MAKILNNYIEELKVAEVEILMLSTAGSIYYFSCDFLWYAISILNYLEEDPRAIEMPDRDVPWVHAHGGVGNLASEERFFPIDMEKMPKAEEEQIHSLAETLGDNLVSQWAQNLQAIAHDCHETNPNITEATWLYYCYCRWLSKTLIEFISILSSPDMRPTLYYGQYQENQTILQELHGLLDREQPLLETQGNSESAKDAQFLIERRTHELARSWRESVYAAVDSRFSL